MMDFFYRLLRAFRYAGLTLKPKHLKLLSAYRDVPAGSLDVDRGELVLAGTNVQIEWGSNEFMLRGISLVNDLRRAQGATFTSSGPNEVLLDCAGFKLLICDWEELFIAHEVLYHGIYNVALDRTYRLIDVGMNVGTTALFHAASPQCAHVDAFELFPATVERARRNLALNPPLAKKISIHGYGLGANNETAELNYFPALKGSTGKMGLPSYAFADGKRPKSIKVAVEFRSASTALEHTFRDAGADALVCKLDCEGSEYEVMNSLSDAKLLTRVTVFMIEWHGRGPDELKDILRANGFACLSFDEHSGTHGMIYGFRGSA
ncbi:MAG: FkbM family methyltransferase [Rickettsiales bacterium]